MSAFYVEFRQVDRLVGADSSRGNYFILMVENCRACALQRLELGVRVAAT